MALPVIADVARIALNWDSTIANSTTATNVIHVRAPGLTTVDVKNALQDNMTGAMWGPVVDIAYLNEFAITLLDGSPDADVFPLPTDATRTGHTGGAAMITSCALIKLGTGGGGRSGRGRIYLPWISEQATAGGGYIDGVAAITAAWVAFANAIQDDGATLCVASYAHATSRDVLTVACEPVMATQRKRLRRP